MKEKIINLVALSVWRFFMPKMGRYYFNGRGREQAYNTFGKTCTRILESESAPDRPHQTPLQIHCFAYTDRTTKYSGFRPVSLADIFLPALCGCNACLLYTSDAADEL